MVLAGLEGGQDVGIDEEPDGSGNSGLARDEACSFQGKDHLRDGGRRHADVTLKISLGRRLAEHDRVGMDEGEVLGPACLKRQGG